MKVVSDSTIFIGLAKIGQVELLQRIFQTIYIPETVFFEVAKEGEQRSGAKEVREFSWIIKQKVSDETEVNLLLASLERGEAEVLVLANEMNADIVLLDEEKARKIARLAYFHVVGLIGILLIAKQMGFIPCIKPYLNTLQRKNFRLSQKIINQALHQAKE